MKYSDFLSVDEHFNSTFDITNEEREHWQTFISNSRYEDNLYQIINSLEATSVNQRKSFWVQGTYGTGKSHATSTIIHLLSDDTTEIEDYCQKIDNSQCREKIINFRANKRIIPVILRGVQGITDSADMIYIIQTRVMQALTARGIVIATKSDIESIVDLIRDPKMASFWDTSLKSNLKRLASTKEQIIEQLQSKHPNLELFHAIMDSFKNSKLRAITHNIDEWLIQVKEELFAQGINEQLIIFWDEFTTLLSLNERNSLLNTIQDIAELSKANAKDNKPLGIYVYLVTHKNMEVVEAYKDLKEDEKRMARDRFLQLQYDMQPTTIYHILSGAINKKNREQWDMLVEQNLKSKPSILNTLDAITKETANGSNEIKERIISLYPFHPYTAYLSTFVSRTIGSAERSIFEFLNDDKKGFKKFLTKDITKATFIDPSYVWDFFLNMFEEDTTSQFSAVTGKYKLNIETVKPQNSETVKVFKTVLLLNILYRVTSTGDSLAESSLVVPNEENIQAAFSGIIEHRKLLECLKYLDEQQIILRSPDGLYEVSFSTLPPEKVASEKRALYPKYEDVTKIMELYPNTCRTPLEKKVTSSIARKSEIQMFWGGETEAGLKNKLLTKFENNYALSIATFFFRGDTPELDALIGRSERAQKDLLTDLQKISKEPVFTNHVFLVFDAPLGEKRLNQYIEYVAQATVATSLKLSDEAGTKNRDAVKWIDSWLKNDILSSNHVRVIFRGDVSSSTADTVYRKLDDVIIPSVFPKGLDRLANIASANNMWKIQSAKATVEKALSSNRDDLETLPQPAGGIKWLLKDNNENYIFERNMILKDSADPKHPMVCLIAEVKKVMKKQQSQASVDLGNEFAFLRKPPYGYYQSHVCMAALAIAMQPLVGNIYISGSGQKVEKTNMRDIIVHMFEQWENDRKYDDLYIRFSTAEERDLVQRLNTLFNINKDGLAEVKWALRTNFEEQHRSPLWTLKYIGKGGEQFNQCVDSLFEFVKKVDEKIVQSDIIKLLEQIKLFETDLSSIISKIGSEDCIRQYIKNELLPNFSQSEVEIPSIIEYLEETLSEKKAFWEERDVLAGVLQWKMKKEMPQDSGSPDTTSTDKGTNNADGSFGATTSDSDNKNQNGKSQQVTKSIQEYNGKVDDLKRILIEISNQYPVVCDLVEELLK